MRNTLHYQKGVEIGDIVEPIASHKVESVRDVTSEDDTNGTIAAFNLGKPTMTESLGSIVDDSCT